MNGETNTQDLESFLRAEKDRIFNGLAAKLLSEMKVVGLDNRPIEYDTKDADEVSKRATADLINAIIVRTFPIQTNVRLAAGHYTNPQIANWYATFEHNISGFKERCNPDAFDALVREFKTNPGQFLMNAESYAKGNVIDESKVTIVKKNVDDSKKMKVEKNESPIGKIANDVLARILSAPINLFIRSLKKSVERDRKRNERKAAQAYAMEENTNGRRR